MRGAVESGYERSRDRHRSRSRDRSRRDRRDRERRRRYDDDDDDDYRRRYRDDDEDRRRRDDDRARERTTTEKKEEKKEEKKGKNEIDDLTKDQRTVFVSQLVIKATERQLRNFFEKIGKVKDVIMIRDKYTNRHKGFAYVEMAELESVPMVLMLNGTLPDFQRFPILVKASEAEKNFLAKQETAAAQRHDAAEDHGEDSLRKTLSIGNLHPKITDDDLRTVLAPFGDVEDVELNASGKALVTFVHADDAAKAYAKVAGIELGAGEPITVSWAPSLMTSPFKTEASSDWRFDNSDDQGGGMALNPQSRALLMHQLGQRAGLVNDAYAPHRVSSESKRGSSSSSGASQPLGGAPSAAFVISNMFDPATETDPNWRQDIQEDVTAECDKFGKVLHVHVDAVSSRGLVHILFHDQDAARQAAESLHGRWFAGRLIAVQFVDPKTHRLQFASEIPS